MGQDGLFTEEQLASRFSLSADTIWEYVRLGLLHPVAFGGYRSFTASAFTRLEVIEKGKRLDFSIDEIKLLMDSVRQPPRSARPTN